MFRTLIQKIKAVMYRMGLISGVKKLTAREDLGISEDFYNQIEKWKALYKGYFEDVHKITYHTIEKGTQTRRMQTLNMPKVSAQEMASLVFNEKCDISISDENIDQFVRDVLKKNKFYRKFQDYLEFMFAMSGMVIKPYVKDDQIKLSYITADCFVPLGWENDTIQEAVFASEYKRGDKTYTHLEWHLWKVMNGERVYVIRNELYETNRHSSDDIGIKVPLETLFPELDEEVIIRGLKKPIFIYFKPNTANNIDPQLPLGIPLYANALDTIKSIDTAFDSFQREFRLGKKRIMLPETMIKTVTDPETGITHRYFDANDEVYEAFRTSDMDSDKITDISVELRVEEHISAINALLNLFAMQTGFSAGTFSFDGQSVKTATEVVSENSKTFKSKKSHETIIEAGLQDVIESILEIAQLYDLLPNGAIPDDLEISVSFDDSIVEDENAEISKQIQLVNNKLTTRKRALMRIHGVTEEEAERMLQEINEENATATAESINFFGGSGE